MITETKEPQAQASDTQAKPAAAPAQDASTTAKAPATLAKAAAATQGVVTDKTLYVYPTKDKDEDDGAAQLKRNRDDEEHDSKDKNVDEEDDADVSHSDLGTADFSGMLVEASEQGEASPDQMATELLAELDGAEDSYALFGDSDGGAGLLLPLLGIALAGLGIFVLVDDNDDDGDEIDDTIVITSATTATIDENSDAGTVVLDVDVDGGNGVTFSLTGADAAAFSIDSDDGEIRFLSSPDFETKGTYNITAVATGSNNNSDSQDITITINDVNEGPAITAPATIAVDENVTAGTSVFVPTFTDPDGDTPTFTLQGADAAAFNVNAATGEVTLVNSPDFETQSSFNVTLVATDPGGLTGSQDVTVNINDLPDQSNLDIDDDNNPLTPVTLDASAANFVFSDSSQTASSVIIQNISADDQINLTGDFTFSVSASDPNDLVIISNTASGQSRIVLDDALPDNAAVFDVLSAEAALGFDLFTNNNAAGDLGAFAANLSGNAAFRDADTFFSTSFTALNDSNVSGVALVGFDDATNTLTVSIQASGLEANQLHPQHIHGFMADAQGNVADAMVPTLAVDADNDGFIELAEGANTYGPVLLDLNSGGNFPTADANGNISFVQTYQLPQMDLGEDPMLALREIVLHGLTLQSGDGTNGGEADGTAGFKAVLPVAAGELGGLQSTDSATLLQLVNAFGSSSVIDLDVDNDNNPATPMTINAGTGSFRFADSSQTASSVVIQNVTSNDQIDLTGNYSFAISQADANDLVIVSNTANGQSRIVLDDVLPDNAEVFDVVSAEAALGFDLFTTDNAAGELGAFAATVTGEASFADADTFFSTSFTALNGSNVSGVALAGFDDATNTLTVTIQASGLEASQLHPQHIHGFMADAQGNVADAMVPTLAVDADNDGFIELAEGADTYGPVLLDLKSGGDFPTADTNGIITFTETYQLPQMDLGEDPMLALREIVLHGLTLQSGDGTNGGEADGTAGFKAVLPVAAGELDSLQGNDSANLLQIIDTFGATGMIA